MIKSSKKAASRARMVKQLDADCRMRVVVYRDNGRCQRCGIVDGTFVEELGRYTRIQWAHVQTREYYVTRWEEQNSLALCDRCHVWFDQHKLLSYEWFRKRWPERWEFIQNTLRISTKTSIAWIKGRYAELKGKELL